MVQQRERLRFLSHDQGSDVFCPFTEIETEGHQSLREGETVAFDLVQGEKGPQADRMKPWQSKLPAPAGNLSTKKR